MADEGEGRVEMEEELDVGWLGEDEGEGDLISKGFAENSTNIGNGEVAEGEEECQISTEDEASDSEVDESFIRNKCELWLAGTCRRVLRRESSPLSDSDLEGREARLADGVDLNGGTVGEDNSTFLINSDDDEDAVDPSTSYFDCVTLGKRFRRRVSPCPHRSNTWISKKWRRMVAGELSPASMEMEGGNSTEAEGVMSEEEAEAIASGDIICVKVKDVLGITPVGGMQKLVYSSKGTFKKLFHDAATKFNITVGQFELNYQDKMDMYELSTMPPNEPLTAANMLPSREKEYTVSISRLSKKNRRRQSCEQAEKQEQSTTEDELLSVAGASKTKDFVGLKNSTMVCYMNSTIQGLFMTPEFRNLVYNSKALVSKQKKSIVGPLQKLFLKLQFSKRDTLDPKELTQTFGWSERDTWIQQDIQELLAVLMDTLEEELKSTMSEGMINALYFGETHDYIKCLTCQNVRSRPESFLVLPLPVMKPTGEPLDNPTLEDALTLYTTPETLSEDNKYECSQCNMKVDAEKGSLFKKLPLMLTIQMKRYGVEWADESMNKRKSTNFKVNNRIEFPVILDMNRFMDKAVASESEAMNHDLFTPPDGNQLRVEHSREGVDLVEPTLEGGDSSAGPSTSAPSDLSLSKEDLWNELKKAKEQNGSNVYELFAVFVHTGGVAGGHYYVYIKDFESYRWYKFDDATVRRVSVEEIEGTFGGAERGLNDVKEPSSAYMLMYRRFDENYSILPMMKHHLPSHLLDNLEDFLQEDDRARDEEIIEKTTIKMTLKYRCCSDARKDRSEEVAISKSLDTKQVALFAFQHLFPDVPPPPADQVRVCRFDTDLGIIENSWEDETQYLTYSLRHPVPKARNQALLLEVRDPGNSFIPFTSEDIVCCVKETDYEAFLIRSFTELHFSKESTVGELRRKLEETWKCSRVQVALIQRLEAEQELRSQIAILNDDNAVLSDVMGADRIANLFAQCVNNEYEMIKWIDGIIGFLHVTPYVLEVQVNTLFQESPADLEDDEKLTAPWKRFKDIAIRAELPEDPDLCTENATAESTEGLAISTVPLPTRFSKYLDERTVTLVNDYWRKTIEANQLVQPFKAIIGVYYQGCSKAGDWIVCLMDTDCRATFNSISRILQDLSGSEEGSFSFFTLRDGDAVEVRDYNLPLRDLLPMNGTLRVRPCQRLLQNEGRLPVFLLDLLDSTKYGIYLGDVVLNPELTSEEVRTIVFEQCNNRAVITALPKERCRVRKRLASDRLSKVCRDDTNVGEWLARLHGTELFLQVLSMAPPQMERDNYSVLFRAWHPSTWVLDPPQEFVVFHDHSQEVAEVIKEKLIEILNVSAENLEVARVEAAYPYEMNPLAVSDLEWFNINGVPRRPLYLYNDELVIFVRDKSEVLKSWTAQEEASFRKDNEIVSDVYHSPYKLELGIKLNLNLSRSSDGE